MNFLLIFSEKPRASVTPYQNGSMLTLTCNATGNPVPVAYWKKDNGDGQFVALEGSGDNHQLGQNVIEVELSEATYGTTYRCVANNTQDYHSSDYTLQGGHLFSSYLSICHNHFSSLQLKLMRRVFSNANEIYLNLRQTGTI